MKDDALAPLNYVVTMRPLPRLEVSNNQGTLDASKGVDAVGEATNMKEHIEAFLGRFKQDRNNEHEASHFYNFVGPSICIHRFSVPLESVPLLEHLRTKHNDFIGQLTVGSVVGNPLLRILAAVLMDMQETQVNALTEERLFKWRNAVRDLHKAGLDVSFFLCHLRDVVTSWFRRDMKIRLASIVHWISELETELAILKSEMAQLQRNPPNAVILDNTAIHGLLGIPAMYLVGKVLRPPLVLYLRLTLAFDS
ncbi:hypothetical protein CFP56_040768 [Quercus suber]|uniref:Uncharacterized protein n=1 Tax=Quercus suber TaxID=58331 RepID=A0AAW0LJP5_QUESU